MKIMIGNRSDFGIEYQINKITKAGPFGTVSLWLAGKRFGDDCGDIYLRPTANRLRFFAEKKDQLVWPKPTYPTNAAELHDLIANEDLSDVWMFYTEGFDEFLALICFSDGIFTVYWVRNEVTPLQVLNVTHIRDSIFTQVVLQFHAEICGAS